MKRYIIFGLFIIFFSFGFIIDQANAAPKLEVNAEVGISGKVKYYKPVPLKITITNNGSDFSGDLVIDALETDNVGSARIYPLNIAEGETKTLNITLNSFMESYNYSGQQQSIFSFYEGGLEKGKEIDYKGTKALRTYSQDPGMLFLFTLTENSDRLSGLFRLNEDAVSGVDIFHLNDIKGYEIPTDSKALELADVLFVDEVSLTDLTNEQQQAIFDWVQSGGILLVGASDQISSSMGIFQSHLPLNLSNERVTISGVNLAKLINGQIDSDVQVHKSTVNKDSKVILKEGSAILAASKKIGNGQVIQTTFSLGDKPLAGMTGYSKLISKILDVPNLSLSSLNGFNDVYYNLTYEVGSINEIFPSFEVTTHWLIIVIIIYILLVGPILYIVLKRMDKREQAWWIIPVMAIALSVIMFLFGAKDRMMNAQIQQSAYFKVSEDKSLDGYYINSLLTNKSGDYKFTVDENTTIAAASTGVDLFGSTGKLHEQSYINEHANGSTLTLRDLKYWSVQSMIGKSTIKNAGNLDVNITLLNNKIEGSIKNNFPFKLKDVAIWSGSREIKLGDIEPNQTLKVSEEVKSTTLVPPTIPNFSSYSSPTKKEDIIKFRLSSLKNNIPFIVQNDNLPVVIGWTDEPIVQTKMEGKSKIDAANYIVQTFKPNIKLSGEFVISNDVMSLNVQQIGNGSVVVYSDSLGQQNQWDLEKGDYEYIIDVPLELINNAKSWKELSLSRINPNLVDLQIWNHKTMKYDEIPNDKKITTKFDEYISDGLIRVKFTYIGEDFQTIRMPDVELKGVAK